MNTPLRSFTRLGLILALAAPMGFAAAQNVDADAPGVRGPRGPRANGARAGGPRAHGRRGHRGRHGHAVRRLLREMDLTDNQRTQIRAIFDAAREQRRELRAQGRSEATRTARRALLRATQRLVQEVLTPAQRAELAQAREAHHVRSRTRRVERMARHLSLSDAQKAAVTRIFENAATRRQALRESDQADRAAHQALRQEVRSELSGVLSAEQMQTLREHRRARRGQRGRHHGRRGRADEPAP